MATTLIVIDVQRALLDELTAERSARLVGTLVPLVARARAMQIPVVYVRHDGSPAELLPGTPEWEIAADIAPWPGDTVVDKRYPSAFRDTVLDDALTRLEADHLVVAGMQTDVCVDATLRDAADRGYRVTLVADGHATSTSGEGAIRDRLHAAARDRAVGIVSGSDLFRP